MALEILHRAPKEADGRHPPILFVHGSYCSAQIWDQHFLPYFCDKSFDCWAFSLRGHGTSDGALSWAGLADFGQDLDEMIASLDRPPILIGHSMGGLVVQHALSRHRIAAAVLLATVPPSGVAASAMHLSMSVPDVLWQLALLQSLGPEAVSGDVIARAFLSSSAAPESGVALRALLQRESPRVAAELLGPSYPKLLRGPDKPPILVLGGDEDRFLPLSSFREAASFFGADLKILQGAPHGLMVDALWWQPTADEILGWLAQQSL